MFRVSALATALLSSTLLAGCQNDFNHDPNKVSLDGPAQLALSGDMISNPKAPSTISPWVSHDMAVLGIDGSMPSTNMDQLEGARNDLVSYYLRDSNQKCERYIQNLTRTQRINDTLFGSLATITGAAGAAFTSASVVRPLAAAASIASGEKAELDSDTFAKQSMSVLITSIRTSRSEAYKTIIQSNFQLDMVKWPLTLALSDVEDYHGRCSLNEGLRAAGVAVTAQATASDISSVMTPAPDVAQVAPLGDVSMPAMGNNEMVPAPPAPAPAQTPRSPSAALFDPAAAAAIARLQLALDQPANGLSPIPVDGQWGSQTATALGSYQMMNGVPASASPTDPATLAALKTVTPPAAVSAAVSAATITQVKKALLAAKPPYCSPDFTASGGIDSLAVGALVSFQKLHGLPQTGVADIPTLAALGVAPG